MKEAFKNKGLRVGSNQFIVIALSERGIKSFTYLKDRKVGQREIYFVKKIANGSFSGAPMLLGQFLAEIEACPDEALIMRPGCTNRIYFAKGDLQDERVMYYDSLSQDEEDEVRCCLTALAKKYPEHIEDISKIMSAI